MNDKDLLEKDLEYFVKDAAKTFGWLYYHTWRSFHSAKGWLDCVLCKPPRLIIAELKREGKNLTEDQQKWFDLLSQIPGIEVYVWRPSDRDKIAEILR